MKQKIEAAIRETLVVENKQSIWRAVDKILLIVEQENKVQQVINRAMLETELSEGEIVRYLEYWLKGKEIERRSGNDR